MTAAVLYLSVLQQRQTRRVQARAIRQQALILRDCVEPAFRPTAARLDSIRHSWTATAKDRWNAEVEGLAARAYRTDWPGVGQDVVDGLLALWTRGASK